MKINKKDLLVICFLIMVPLDYFALTTQDTILIILAVLNATAAIVLIRKDKDELP